MKDFLRKKKESSIDVMAIEHHLNPQIYNHLSNTIQGYLFSKPVPADAFAALLKKGKIETPIVSKQDII